MSINRHNYEEYFLLYTDNELNATEKMAVEEFVQQHPDLQIELEMLQQSTLQAEPIVFHSKDLLLKNSSSLINETNFEEYFVLYTDDELSIEEKDMVEQFVYRNARYRADFELMQQATLQVDRNILFPDKSILYRTEKMEEKAIVLPWWKIAAAAIVFIFLSGLGWYMVSKDNTTPAVVTVTPNKRTELPLTSQPKQEKESIVQTKPEATEVLTPETVHVVAAKKQDTTTIIRQPKKQEPQQLLTNRKEDDKNIDGRNIRLATTVTPERRHIKIREMETSGALALQNNKKHIVDQVVGNVEENPYGYLASTDEIEILNTTISKKNKLRGIFRKVSRVVEKTTNIEATENGRGIRIANFEIALK